MIGPSSRALWGATLSAMLGASVVAAQKLEDVLAKQANLTTFRGLVKDHGDIFSKLPKSGVTILAPSDSAYLKGQGWDADADAVPVALRYGIISRAIAFGGLLPGDSSVEPTLLADPKFSNVTGGASVLVAVAPSGDVVVTSGLAQRTTAVATDLAFDGGLVQVVDSLMVTPGRLERTARDAYRDLTAFLGALYAAGLVAEFAETPDATVFAPRNAAFQRVAGALAGLSRDELRRVLRYHLVPGEVLGKSQLVDGSRLVTAAGNKSVAVTLYNNDIFVGSARVIQTDILVANGVVQVLDAVLNVDAADALPDVTAVTQAPVFTATGATETGSGAPTPFASELPCTTDCPVSGTPGGGGSGATATGGMAPSSTNGGAAAARCTGVIAAGVGLGFAVGVLGMEAVGAVV